MAMFANHGRRPGPLRALDQYVRERADALNAECAAVDVAVRRWHRLSKEDRDTEYTPAQVHAWWLARNRASALMDACDRLIAEHNVRRARQIEAWLRRPAAELESTEW